MSSLNPRPKWWQLYLTFPLLIMLFMVDHRMRLSQRGHVVVQIGIVLLVYGLIHLWLKANAVALSKMDRDQYRGTIRVIRLPLVELPDVGVDKRRILQLSHSEITGLLSDTYEMDTIDAETFPIDKVSQEELKKE